MRGILRNCQCSMNVQSVCNAGRLLLLVYLSLLIYYGGKHRAEFSGVTRNEQMDVCKEKNWSVLPVTL